MEFGPILRAMKKNKVGVALLAVEIAFTLAIALNCINIMMDQRRRINTPTGMDEANIFAIVVSPYGRSFEERQFRQQLIERDTAKLRALPGVVDAAPISNLPLRGGGSSSGFRPYEDDRTQTVRAPVYYADQNFLNTLGLELLEGRAFTEADLMLEPGPQPASCIVTKDLADALYPEGGALGKMIGNEPYPDTIVGIVKHMHTPYGGGPLESRILFYGGRPGSATVMQYLVRTEPGKMNEVMAQTEKLMLEIESERVIELRTLLEVKGQGYLQNIIISKILSVVIGLLIFVTGIGMLGMTSFAVARRSRIIGVRRALGASKLDIVRYFLVENSMIAFFGIAWGLLGAFVLNSLLMQNGNFTSLSTALVFGGVVFLWIIGILATLMPAVKGSRIAPAVVTRAG